MGAHRLGKRAEPRQPLEQSALLIMIGVLAHEKIELAGHLRGPEALIVGHLGEWQIQTQNTHGHE